jgi:hypothetical protein
VVQMNFIILGTKCADDGCFECETNCY